MAISKHWRLLVSIISLVALYLLDYYALNNPLSEIIKNMINDSLGAILIYLAVSYLLPKEDPHLDAINTLETKMNLLIEEEKNRYGIVTRLMKISRSIIDNTTLAEQLHSIARSKDASRECYKSLGVFFDDVITDKVREIEDASRGFIRYGDESKRISEIRKLFDHIRSVPNVGKLYALSWDYNDYFYRYWGQLSLDREYLDRNASVADHNVKIDRLFIFNKDTFDDNKRLLLNQIHEATEKMGGVETRWMYEHDIANIYLRSKQSSFLLVETKDTELIIATQSEGPGNESGELYLALHNQGINKKLHERFKMLWHIKKQGWPVPLSEK